MAVEALANFPRAFVAGDTLRVSITDGDYPSPGWTLKVLFRSPSGAVFSYDATDDGAAGFTFVIPAVDTAQLSAGEYAVTYVWTEAATGERISETIGATAVLPDPTAVAPKSVARQTLEAMEAALQSLASGANLTVSFNGQSFTRRNLKDFQDAIDRQRSIVRDEEKLLGLASGLKQPTGIGIRFANS